MYRRQVIVTQKYNAVGDTVAYPHPSYEHTWSLLRPCGELHGHVGGDMQPHPITSPDQPSLPKFFTRNVCKHGKACMGTRLLHNCNTRQFRSRAQQHWFSPPYYFFMRGCGLIDTNYMSQLNSSQEQAIFKSADAKNIKDEGFLPDDFTW